MSATMILHNGRIHTLNPQQPTATAVAIRDGKVLAVGFDDEIKPLLAAGGELVNLNGRTLTPGLVDAHVHFQHFALSLQRVDLRGSKTLDEALQRIATKISNLQSLISNYWLQGRGWRVNDWGQTTFPTAAHLDAINSEIPICLRDHSGHAAWVNSRALQIANITAQTADPPGGQIQRDENGRPTGVLFEDAMDLVTRHIPDTTTDQIADAMREAQQYCWRVGLTGLHDFDGRACFIALQTLLQNGELGLRVVKNVPVYRLEHAIGVGLRSGFGNDWLRIGSVKIFADGALGPRTAAMIAPYEGEPNNYGIVVTDKEEMLEKASAASAKGLSITVHAIGDKANHDVLDVFEAVRKQEIGDQRLEITDSISNLRSTNLRHRIEHVQLIHPADQPRLAQLNIIASMQPIHATSDMEAAERHWGSRTKDSYAIRTMLNSGATVVFGSDAPIEKIDPLLGIHAAVTRQRPDGSPGPDGWHPEQKLTMAETIHGFTTAAAITCGQEARQGSIAPGKLADFTIFGRDIFAIPPDELLDVEISGTVVGGEFKHRTFS
ncbi:amidohydrolase [Candidatus Leptofilum sp.]|uniref:amidohydrolase n=1 Tax=Candidatus Leptofilum sp. TaxID=3241576 RepID=UPI003B5A5336